MASIEQIADRIADQIKPIIVTAVEAEFSPAGPAPQTYSAAEAWEKMEEGWRVRPSPNYPSGDTAHMNADGKVEWQLGGDSYAKVFFAGPDNETRYTLHGIHPKAHEYALQRLIAAGLKVGSVVEVAHRYDDIESRAAWQWRNKYSTGEVFTVEAINHSVGALKGDYEGGHYIPAHCLRLVSAEPQPQPGEKWWVEVEVEKGPDWQGDCCVLIAGPGGRGFAYIPASALKREIGGGE